QGLRAEHRRLQPIRHLSLGCCVARLQSRLSGSRGRAYDGVGGTLLPNAGRHAVLLAPAHDHCNAATGPRACAHAGARSARFAGLCMSSSQLLHTVCFLAERHPSFELSRLVPPRGWKRTTRASRGNSTANTAADALWPGCSRNPTRDESVAAARARSWSRLRHPVCPGGALRRSVEVLRQNPRRVRDTLEAGDAAHVHDVRRPFAFDDVDAVQVDAERPTAARGDVAKLRREREGLAVFLRFGPAGEDLLHPEQPVTDHVELAIAAPSRCSAPARLKARPLVFRNTYRSCSTRTRDMSTGWSTG